MTLQNIGEFGLIKKISPGCLIRKKNILRGIGDDAAAFIFDAHEVTLVTTDLLVEGVHFLRTATSGFNLGYKSLAVNLSDIAAMGGVAREAFVSIGIPDSCGVEYIEDIYRGIKSLAGEFGVNILGGDTTRSLRDLIINICVVGLAHENEILYRNSAKPGDALFSTGFLGDSKAGLHLILNNISADSTEMKQLIHRHLLPTPQLGEGRFLSIQNGVHAAIDVSDGLSSDVCHIAEESRVGVRIHADKIPISDELKFFCNRLGLDPHDFALAGGEDYVILCTISPDQADAIAENFFKEFKRPLYPIGQITDSGGMEVIYPDGRTKSLHPRGWNHFRKNE